MTREEAIKEIEKAFKPAFANYIITALTEGATVSDKEPMVEIDLYSVIKQKYIEREVLDKIRAEIMQLDYDTEFIDYDYNDMAQTEEVHTIYREEVLQIIDKYKVESEEANRNDD